MVPSPVPCPPDQATSRYGSPVWSRLLSLFLDQGFCIRIAGPEMLQHDERIGCAWIFDAHSHFSNVRGDEYFVLRHLSETDHGGSRQRLAAQRSVALGHDHSVGRAI